MSNSRQSSLFNFFKQSTTPKSTKTPINHAEELKLSKRINDENSDEEELQRKPKRRKIVLSSDEEENMDESLGSKPPKTPTHSNSSAQFSVARSLIHSFQSPSVASNERVSAKKSDAKLSVPTQLEFKQKFLHETFPFLQKNHMKDIKLRRPDDPNYDSTTLNVPPDFLKEQTPGHRQWWTIKSSSFDTVILFKVGKFYELYHMDAVIAVEALGLAFMKGNYAHAGFPEVAYGKFADQLVSRGYKVARVEQTETPQQLDERNLKRSGAKDKVVRRELCRIISRGTKTHGVLEGADNGLDGVDSSANYLIAIKENVSSHTSTYGICFVDTSIGKFWCGEFADDDYRSSLRTILASRVPVQVLLEKGNTSSGTQAVLNNMLSSVPKEYLNKNSQFLSAQDAIKKIMHVNLLGSEVDQWPKSLQEMLHLESVVPKSSDSYQLAWSALGAVVWYLNRCLIDVDLVTMKNFELFQPCIQKSFDGWNNRVMIIDGVTIKNLNLVPSGDSYSDSFSLYSVLNKCLTPFGKRLLWQWICSPTCDPITLNQRQESITVLMDSSRLNFTKTASGFLKNMPDLERLSQKIHTLGLKYRATEHPDSRAVLFDVIRYNKKKVNDLLTVLEGFRSCLKVFQSFLVDDASRFALLEELLDDKELVKELQVELMYFDKLFDHEAARKSGCIVPERGNDAGYDAAVENVEEMTNNIEAYRREQEKKIRCKIVYYGTGKNRFQMEIPENTDLPNSFELKSKKKGFGRYQTPQLVEMIEDLTRAENSLEKQASDATRKVFELFDTKKDLWLSVSKRIAIFDVLLSLSSYSKSSGLEMCMPVFDFESYQPYMSIKQGCHPGLASAPVANGVTNVSSFISNDTTLGGEVPSSVVITGPNMGGKSTLIRQVAVLTVLAQMGSRVPAREMRLTPVDRIFTRIGANDKISCGQSTFFVEMNETQIILRDASLHSLVLIDELGRGTSTYDGTAIASAVLSELSQNIRCRTLFSTHYHSICNDFAVEKSISLAHMACMVENENEDDPTEECVTFLYQLKSGICPKSYGFYAAKLAGISETVVRKAYNKSKEIFSMDCLTDDWKSKMKMTASGDLDQLEKMVACM